MHSERIRFLLAQYAANNCTEKELAELFEAITKEENTKALEDALQLSWQQMQPIADAHFAAKDKVLANILNTPKVLQVRKHTWWRYAAAAAVLLFTMGSYLFISSRKAHAPETHAVAWFKNDVPAGTTKATLILADGTRVVLDSAKSGSLARQGSTTIVNDNGVLSYQPGSSPDTTYNTLQTANGEQSFSLALSDGTRVWLNAASSIRFPVAFFGNQRAVEITGEAYFEVAKNKEMPFRVKVNDMQVEVLGTHFNINAYADEPAIKTTLLEGSVKVTTNKGQPATILQPGQQAQLGKEGPVKVLTQADTEAVMAWKNGLFSFKSADIEMVMRQVARWYNVKIDYQSRKTTDRFTGNIARTATLVQLLTILQYSNVHFAIDGKTITVLP